MPNNYALKMEKDIKLRITLTGEIATGKDILRVCWAPGGPLLWGFNFYKYDWMD